MGQPKIYIVNGSHPCAAVLEAAGKLKGSTFKRVGCPPPSQPDGDAVARLRRPHGAGDEA